MGKRVAPHAASGLQRAHDDARLDFVFGGMLKHFCQCLTSRSENLRWTARIPFCAYGPQRPLLALRRRSVAANQATFPRALLATDHRRSISFTATFMLGRYFRAATSGVIDDEKKIRFRLPRTGPPPGIASAMALMPASDPPTDDA